MLRIYIKLCRVLADDNLEYYYSLKSKQLLFDFAFVNAVASLSKREILRDAIEIVLVYASNFNEDGLH